MRKIRRRQPRRRYRAAAITLAECEMSHLHVGLKGMMNAGSLKDLGDAAPEYFRKKYSTHRMARSRLRTVPSAGASTVGSRALMDSERSRKQGGPSLSTVSFLLMLNAAVFVYDRSRVWWRAHRSRSGAAALTRRFTVAGHPVTSECYRRPRGIHADGTRLASMHVCRELATMWSMWIRRPSKTRPRRSTSRLADLQ